MPLATSTGKQYYETKEARKSVKNVGNISIHPQRMQCFKDPDSIPNQTRPLDTRILSGHHHTSSMEGWGSISRSFLPRRRDAVIIQKALRALLYEPWLARAFTCPAAHPSSAPGSLALGGRVDP